MRSVCWNPTELFNFIEMTICDDGVLTKCVCADRKQCKNEFRASFISLNQITQYKTSLFNSLDIILLSICFVVVCLQFNSAVLISTLLRQLILICSTLLRVWLFHFWLFTFFFIFTTFDAYTFRHVAPFRFFLYLICKQCFSIAFYIMAHKSICRMW